MLPSSVLKKVIVGYFGFKATQKVIELKKEAEKEKKRKSAAERLNPSYGYGFYSTSFKKFKDKDPEKFFKVTRMNAELFDILLRMLLPNLMETSVRTVVEPECRLALTLMYLAHGGSKNTYAKKFKMGLTTVRNIMIETCKAIWVTLQPMYLPDQEYIKWDIIEENYRKKWNLSNCVGAIDGKYINLVTSQNKKVCLLATSDENYKFTSIDIIPCDGQSNDELFQENMFDKLLNNNHLSLPPMKNLHESGVKFPYFFVGDACFSQTKDIMTPFCGRILSDEENTYNKRIARARTPIENAFGIMSTRWRILLNDLHCSHENANIIIKAVVVLHNFLLGNKCLYYCNEKYGDQIVDGDMVTGWWRFENPSLHSLEKPINLSKLESNEKLVNDLMNYLNEN